MPNIRTTAKTIAMITTDTCTTSPIPSLLTSLVKMDAAEIGFISGPAFDLLPGQFFFFFFLPVYEADALDKGN